VIIPDHLTVGGHNYKVIRDYKFREREDIEGQADHGFKEIRLAESNIGGVFKHTRVEENFMHELLHCVDHVYNAQKMEEETVTRISQGLYQVLKVNDMFAERNDVL